MRKGFILTLTALVSAFMVTSTMAMGPTIAGVPDVYIGSQDETFPFVNMFRYTDALTLWDYVTPGVVTGDGSSSDTLYWAWAAKDATLSGGTGSYLSPGNINYSIIQENGIEALLLTPTHEVGAAGYGAEINADLSATGSSLPDYSLASAGKLTFRNVRLSPTPDQASYPAPVATSGLPAGYLDLQEATLYVSDTTTTDLGTQKILLATIDSTINSGNDFLSGGLQWHLDDDLTNSGSDFGSFSIDGTSDAAFLGPIDSGTIAFSQTTTSLSANTPLANPTLNGGQAGWQFGQWQRPGSATLDPSNLYRAEMSLTSTCASGANPHIFIGFNNRATVGFGFTQIVAGATAGPGASASKWAGYLVPTESGTAPSEFAIYDPPVGGPYGGGTITATNIQLQSLPLAQVLATATSTDVTTSFNAGTDGNTQWTYFDIAYAGTGITSPVFSHTPSTASTVSDLVMSAQSGSSTFGSNNIPVQQGLASWQGPVNQYTDLVPGKLALCRATLSTSTPGAGQPSVLMTVIQPTQQPTMQFDHDQSGTNGPTSTPSDYYVVFEPTETTGNFILRILVDRINVNGDLHLTKVEMLQAPMPFDP